MKKRTGTTLSTVSYLLLIVLCSLLTIHCSAQLHGQAKIDSLLKELPRQKEDTNKVLLLNKLSNMYASINAEVGIKYGMAELELSKKLNWKFGMAGACYHLGSNYELMSDYQSAIKYYSMALKLYEETGNKQGVPTLANAIGNIYAQQANYPKALKHYSKAKELFEETGNKGGIAGTICNIGNIEMNQGNLPNALANFFKALTLFEEVGDKGRAANATASIGNIFWSQDNYPKALEYFLKACKVMEEIGDKKRTSMILVNIGSVYDEGFKDYSKALEYYHMSLNLANEAGAVGILGVVYGNIGEVYAKQKNYIQAAAYFKKGLALSKKLGETAWEAKHMSSLGILYLDIIKDRSSGVVPRRSQFDKTVENSTLPINGFEHSTIIPQGRVALLSAAMDYLQKSLVISKEIKELVKMQICYHALTEAYILKGEYRKAMVASDNYHAITDSLFSQENKEEILKMSLRNEYERQRLTDSLKVAHQQNEARVELQRQKSYTYAGIAGVLLLGGFSFFIFKERRKSEMERKKSDGLLLNILPQEVAEELKAKGVTSANHYDNVTVLFTDFVNFTQASESMSPQALIDELHTCFKAFDEITNKYGIEKIKTIGDAYLAVAGLPTADPEHAQHAVSAAKEITAFMSDRLAKLGRERTFEVRIGVHSGSVVAGVVGVKKFAYDIWGDTVNTAARMEQNSEAGKINISQSTYELVKGRFTCEYRGEVEAKGKGAMKMYYVS